MSHESKSTLPVWFIIVALIVLFSAVNWCLGYMEHQRKIWAVEASKTPVEYAYKYVLYMKTQVDFPQSIGEYPAAWTDIRAKDNKIQLFFTMGTPQDYDLLSDTFKTNDLYKQETIKKAGACRYWNDGILNPSKGAVLEFFMSYQDPNKIYNYILTPKDCGL